MTYRDCCLAAFQVLREVSRNVEREFFHFEEETTRQLACARRATTRCEKGMAHYESVIPVLSHNRLTQRIWSHI